MPVWHTSLKTKSDIIKVSGRMLIDIREDRQRVGALAKENEEKYDKLREEKAYSIDVTMKEYHKLERQRVMAELGKKHLAEKDAKKAEYRALVAEFKGHGETINKELEDIIQNEANVEREMKHSSKNLSLDDILAHMDKEADRKRMRKRRKTEGIPARDIVRAAPFNNKAESGGHPLPLRVLFGKLEKGSRNVWAWLHNKPGSNRTPEVRLKVFSRTGQPEEPIALQDAMEKATPLPAFTCLKPQDGRFDRTHLSSVLRYYFILQKVELPYQWPISDVFVAELRAACKVAEANAKERKGAGTKEPEDMERTGHGEVKPTLTEMLSGESAEASLPGSTLAGTQSPMPSPEETPATSPEAFIEAYKLNIMENELEELEEEEDTLKNALKQAKEERKRLRTSVSERDLVLLQLGQDLAHTVSKRLLFDDSGEE
ncbi:hypothetical protein SLS61_009200 [Didymella pomorum]